ncbi:MAG: DNA repair and recombination protein RadA [Patescibacteria group bacterium]|nr:DNA repair and recombination protein RadA [Patescibacteria group bacterium]
MTDLSQIKAITSRQITLLQQNGISTAEGLAMSPISEVSAIDGLSDKSSKKLIWNARDALGMTEFTAASEIHENTEYIVTGSKGLNEILGGGVHTGKITEVFGAFKSGKTALAHTIAVAVQLPKERGGLGGSVVYLDTENTFSKEKIIRIAKRFGLKPNDVLSHIFPARIYSSDHQIQMVHKTEALCRDRNVRLIVVDSLMALFRAEYVGIGMLARRQGVINNMLHSISRIAEVYNCAILLTNQVSTKMLGSFSSNDAIGGNIVAHACHFRIQFKSKGFSANSSLQRRAVIVDAPDLPPNDCEFFITSVGIADTDKIEKEVQSNPEPFILEQLYEEDESEEQSSGNGKVIPISNIAGIGAGTAKKLKDQGIENVEALLNCESKKIAAEINGISDKMIDKYKKSAKALVS